MLVESKLLYSFIVPIEDACKKKWIEIIHCFYSFQIDKQASAWIDKENKPFTVKLA